MADDTDDDKTEEPTEKRLADAIERGNTPVSREIAFLASLARLSADRNLRAARGDARRSSRRSRISSTIPRAGGWRRRATRMLLDARRRRHAGAVLGPAVLLLMAFGVGGSVLQNPPRIVASRIAPDFKRLSPFSGFARLFGPRGWTEFVKAALKLGAVAARRRCCWSAQRWRWSSTRCSSMSAAAAATAAVALRRGHGGGGARAARHRRRRFHLDAHSLAARSAHEPA